MTNMLKRFLITLLILLLSVFLIGMTIYYQQVSNDKTIFEIQAVESLNGQNEQILNEFTYDYRNPNFWRNRISYNVQPLHFPIFCHSHEKGIPL